MIMDTAGVDIIVDAVVGKSLRKQEGCNSYIFDKVRQRVLKEVKDLVSKGASQLDVILLQKKRLQAIFMSEKLLYEQTKPIVIEDTEEKTEKKLQQSPAENKIVINGDAGMKLKVKKYLEDQKPTEMKRLEIKIPLEKKPIEKKSIEIKPIEMKGEEKKMDEKKVGENKLEEKKAEKQTTQTKQYFEYLAEYKNDIDVYERVKGMEVRGKLFPLSNDGSCPRCSYKSNVFVVLDFLFPAGDMPEILHYLLTLGKAVLWSSKDNMNCKDPPIFLCQGRCPADITKCGFNINWRTTDIDKIFLFPHENYKEPKIKVNQTVMEMEMKNGDQLTTKGSHEVSSSSDSNMSSDDEYDEGEVDIEYYKNKVSWVVLDEVADTDDKDAKSIDETSSMIRNMLALEEARFDYTNGQMIKKVQAEEKERKEERKGTKLLSVSPEKSIISSKGKKVSVNAILNDINNRLQQSRFCDDPNRHPPVVNQPKSLPTPNPSRSDVPPKPFALVPQQQPPKVFTNAASAAYAIASRDNCKIASTSVGTSVQPKTQNKPKTVAVPTPTHILKGATYYNETKEVKTSKPAFTVHDFPISKDGVCPYCHSSDVVYIILQEDGDTEELPGLLKRLFTEGKAVKRKRGEYDLPSFQCKGCTYGFNLDWKSTNLKKIFPKNPVPAYSSQNNVNTSMNYTAAYTNMATQYMYNSYPSQSYVQTATPASFAMNTYAYMRPQYQPFQGPYANFMAHQYANMSIVGLDYSMPPPGFQDFRERFPPPNTEIKYSAPPAVTSSSSFNKKFVVGQPSANTYTGKSNVSVGTTPHTYHTTTTNAQTCDDTSDVSLGKSDAEGVGVDPMTSASSKNESNSTESSGGNPDVKSNDTENDSTSDLYDPFDELDNDQSINEDANGHSNESENNSVQVSDESCAVPSSPKIGGENEVKSSTDVIEEAEADITTCTDSTESERDIEMNEEIEASTTGHIVSNDVVDADTSQITSVIGRRVSSRITRKTRSYNTTDPPTNNSIDNCLDNESTMNSDMHNNSDTCSVDTYKSTPNADASVTNTDTCVTNADTCVTNTDTSVTNTDTSVTNTDTSVTNTDTSVTNNHVNTEEAAVDTNISDMSTDTTIKTEASVGGNATTDSTIETEDNKNEKRVLEESSEAEGESELVQEKPKQKGKKRKAVVRTTTAKRGRTRGRGRGKKGK